LIPNDLKGKKMAEIRQMIDKLDPAEWESWIGLLEADGRKGVANLGLALDKRKARLERDTAQIREKKRIEEAYRKKGFALIAGMDEVGRGPLAGPVVCAAVILPEDSAILHVDDSKKLSAARREELAPRIKEEALAWAIGIREPAVIDRINILEATKEAMAEAVGKLTPPPDLLLIDAVDIPSAVPVASIIHGDALCYSIAAASIVAKVHRDHLMMEYHQKYPQYGFDHNMGYGTAQHLAALRQYGPTPIHRKTFIQGITG